MAIISIDNINLTNYDKNNIEQKRLYDELTLGNSKSDMIHQIKERLDNSKEVEKLEFDNAYIIYIDDNIIGYLYLTGKRVGSSYIEISLLKDMRGKHIGSYLLNTITNYILENNNDLKEIRASIDISNLASMKVAEYAGFYYNEDDYQKQKIDFIKDNPYYVRKER